MLTNSPRVFLKQKLFLQGYQTFINWFYLYLSYIFQKRRCVWCVAKLGAYGFDTASLKVIRSYLTNRFQRTKVNAKFSSWSKLFLGESQGSVLGPLLFNIYINDLFCLTEMTDVCN